MDFLNNLYSNDNFGIILFTFISILVLAFLIILFFGKKDQKERELAVAEKNNNNSNNNEINLNSEVAFGQNAQGTMLEVNSAPTNMNNSNNMMMNNQMYNQMGNTVAPQMNTFPQPPIQQEEYDSVLQPPKTDFDFDALAASISKELESIGVEVDDTDKTLVNIPPIPVEEPTPIIEEKTMSPIMNQNPVVLEPPFQDQSIQEQPIQEQPVQVTPIPIQEMKVETPVPPIIEKPVIEEKMTLPNPSQFSSVYVNKKMEPEPMMVEPKPVEPSPTPVSKPMEMPKTIDLPKLNTESTPKVEPIKEKDRMNDVFSSLENNYSAYPNNNENRM